MTDAPHTSFSRLDQYLRCSFKYMFKYELNLKGAPNLNMARGSAGHTALELNARHKIETGEDQPVAQILDNFSAEFDKEMAEVGDEGLLPGDDPGKTKDETIEVLRYYAIKEAPLVQPLSVELEFLAPFPQTEEHHEPIPPIKGFIDYIAKRTRQIMPNARPVERIELMDRKFPQRKPSNSLEKAILSPQLTMYDMVLWTAGKRVDDIGFENYIPPTKTIGPRIEPIYRPPEWMTPEARETRHARLMFVLRRVYRAITRGDTYSPVDDPRVCAGCEFRKRCQASLAKDDYIADKLTSEMFQI